MAAVSIIIPAYNTEDYLEACLDSIKFQTFDDFECIVVNDGSTDNTARIVENFIKEDPRFQLINQENAGPSVARNIGISKATSPWLTFVDSDDMIAPTYLETLFSILDGSEIACCGSRKFSELPAPIPGNKETFQSKKSIRKWSPEDALAQALYQDKVPDLSAWNKLYAAHLWKDVQFPAGKYFEDIYIIPQILMKANKIASISLPLYLYRQRESSILHSAYDSKMAELMNIAEHALETVKKHNAHIKLIHAAENTVISASFSILMRTTETEEFHDVRNRAWQHIHELRFRNILDSKVRFKNKVASILSYLPQKTFLKFLNRGRK